jgi:hypothetical protein
MSNVLDIINISDSNGNVDVDQVLRMLSCSETELVGFLGLDQRVWSNLDLRTQLENRAHRQHLLQIICIANFVYEMGATKREAFEWLVREFEYVLDYLQSFKLGGFA